MTHTTGPVAAETQPRTSTLDRATLIRIAATEYDRFATLLLALTPEDWTRPTECDGWDVRAMATHTLGMAEMAASIREGSRQQKAAKKRGGVFIDALSSLQVEERSHLTPTQLTDRFLVVGPRAARGRRRTPGLIRRRRMPVPQAVGDRLETWSLGYLIDTILTRDPWMHRVDISRATGHPLNLTADHDAILVADVAHEWALRHGRPCHLHLTGPAGGAWTFGLDGPTLDIDAIEFCRTLSGREPAAGLLATEVPF
jgi:uncharacterized protein (TIGR03083 family)